MSNSNKIPNNLIPLGKILKPKGLKGEIKVFLYNKDSNSLEKNKNIWIKDNNEFKSFKIEYLKIFNRYKIIKLKDVDSIENAKILVDKKLFVSRIDFPDSDAFYLVDLIGFLAKDESNNIIGKVKDIINLPTNDSLLIEYNDKEVMIPIIDDFIELFDYDAKYVIIKNSNTFINKC